MDLHLTFTLAEHQIGESTLPESGSCIWMQQGLTCVWWVRSRHYGQGKSMDCYNRLAILKGIASGLESMHTAGIAHLDIKPANVMVEPECHHEAARIILDDNEVRLGDFGLCRPLAAGQQVSSR